VKRSTSISRRRLISSIAPVATLFPYLSRAFAEEIAPTPRLILLMQSNGTTQANFWPTPVLTDSKVLAPLLDDANLRRKTTVIKGLFNEEGGAGNGHDFGFAGLWSGYKTVGPFHDPWGNGPSIDQLLKQKLSFHEPNPTLNCGVLASSTAPFKNHRTSFSYLGPHRQVPTETNIYKLYTTYFSPPIGEADSNRATSAELRIRQNRSVLDYVREDLRQLKPRLPVSERPKLEFHETAVRDLEKRLSETLAPRSGRPDWCGRVVTPKQRLDVILEENVPLLMQWMFDFVAQVISCGLVRIVTFPMGNCGEKWYFSWLGINQNSHDTLAHADNGDNADVTAKLLKINVWYAQQVAALARKLDGIPEGNGTSLDNTLIVWGNEIATGPHTMEDIPVVLVGNGAGRIRNTGRLINEGRQPYQRLGTSVLRLMGVPADGLGESPNCGPLVGLD